MADSSVAEERRDFYVYIIFNPAGIPIYVGKGRGRRWSEHSSTKCHNRLLKQAYFDAGGNLPIVKVREDITEPEAFATEISLIAIIGRQEKGAGPLFNGTDGGDGASGKIVSQEHKEKLRQLKTGRVVSEETKAKLRAANLGKPRSKEAIEKQRKAMTGMPRSAEWCAAISQANIGRHHNSEAHRATMSARAKGNKWAVGRRSRTTTPKTYSRLGKTPLGEPS